MGGIVRVFSIRRQFMAHVAGSAERDEISEAIRLSISEDSEHAEWDLMVNFEGAITLLLCDAAILAPVTVAL